MAGELDEHLESERARVDALEILVSGLMALVVRHGVLPAEVVVDGLREAEDDHRRQNAHAALLETLRTAREVAEEQLGARRSSPPSE